MNESIMSGFPTPGRDGKWLLSEVIEWENGK